MTERAFRHVTLEPVDAAQIDEVIAGHFPPYAAAPGWPHAETAIALEFARAGGVAFLVVDADLQVIGECGTKGPPTADGTVEISYALAGPSRGRGLGTSAVSALIGRLEDLPDINAIEAEVAEGNAASRRLLDFRGFAVVDTRDGYVRYRLRP